MKTIIFTLSVSFDGKIIDDNDIKEIAQNIVRVIKNEEDSGTGISPENSELFTTEIEIVEGFSGIYVHQKIV